MGDIEGGIPSDCARVDKRWQWNLCWRDRQPDPCELGCIPHLQRGNPHIAHSDRPCHRQLYDLHRKQILYSLNSHTDTITSLTLSPSGSYLFSFSLDSSLRVWDVRPFAISSSNGDAAGQVSEEDRASQERLYRTLSGALNGADALLIKGGWSRDGRRIILGSGDRTCVVWE